MKYNVDNLEFQSAKAVADKLRGSGFAAYFAGGCVRDLILGREPNDFDIATDAKPEQVEALFDKTVAIGKAFGIILVVYGDYQIEVASFRKDGLYVDGRRPEGVSFSTPLEDAHRRDFTMNGLFYDLQKNEIIDFVEGREALKKKIIQAIGDPAHRFQEDQLRILRAVRFQSQLNFDIETETLKAISEKAALVNSVSGERIFIELEKLIVGACFDRALQTLVQTGLLQQLLGGEQVIWRSASTYFRVLGHSAEERWVSFFVWLSIVLKNGASLEFFERLCLTWKFSKDLKKKTLRSLNWIFEKDIFSRYRLGEMLERSFEIENERGLSLYATFFLAATDRDKFLAFERAREYFHGHKPEALICADAFAGKLVGPELGSKLKEAYWLQLENPLLSKAEIFAKLKVSI